MNQDGVLSIIAGGKPVDSDQHTRGLRNMNQESVFAIVADGKSIVFDLPDRNDYIQREIFRSKTFYELDVLEEVGRLPIGDGVVCDIGANIGNHSLYFSIILGRKVFAFEPVRETFELLASNVCLNRCEDSIELFNLALGAAMASGAMTLTPGNLGASKFVRSPSGDTSMATLDASLPTGTEVALVKIDVEGSEYDVLVGASNTIKRCNPLLIIEAQSHLAYVKIARLLEPMGYEPISMKGKTATFFFIHRSKWENGNGLGTFLVRKDLDHSSRRLHGQLDRIAKSISQLPIQDVLEKATRDISSPLTELKTRIETLSDASREHVEQTGSALGEQLGGRLDRIAESVGQLPQQSALDRVAKHISSPLAELKAQIGTFSNSTRAHVEQTGKALSENLGGQLTSGFAAITLRQEEFDQAKKEIAELEAEVARLLIAVQTERTRAQYVSRRLNTLYTSGVRLVVGKLLRLLGALSFGKIKPHETWPQFEKRLEVRVKREIDDFKKMHTRVAMQAARRPVEKATASTMLQSHASISASCIVAAESPLRVAIPELQLGRERVRVGIASIEIRRTALARVIDCLYDQVDELVIYLNDYAEIPAFLQREKIRVIHNAGDVGDRGKFYEVENFQGYVFTCDDDIHYPPYYVRHCIDAIERYGRKAAVGWHGSAFKSPFEDYYSPDSRRVFSFRSGRPVDTAAHVLGTGCTAFHSSTIKVRFSDFKTSNMADVYFALLGQQQRVPFVVIKHDAGEALPLDIPDDKAINQESMKKTGSKADTRVLQNQMVKDWKDWQAELPPLAYQRDLHTIAYVGRIEKERWKKGGILKSGHLILESLRALGHRVVPVEISQSLEQLMTSVKDAKIVWIYPGDPERPDFKPVEELIEFAAKAGKQVYVNLSYNLKPSRDDWISSRLDTWAKKYGTKVKACVFTYAGTQAPALTAVQSNLLCIPKTIDFDRSIRAQFSQTDGIFLGDLQKLLNRQLVGGQIEDWIDALREALPEAKLYAVRQYGGKIDRELGLTVLPYTTGLEWEQWLAMRRLACCLTPHATFEMIPVEAAGLGVPVIYKPMPQSHSETLSVAGICVETPAEFARACAMLYRDPTIWGMYSEAGRLRAQSQHIDYAAAAIHAHLTLGCI